MHAKTENMSAELRSSIAMVETIEDAAGVCEMDISTIEHVINKVSNELIYFLHGDSDPLDGDQTKAITDAILANLDYRQGNWE